MTASGGDRRRLLERLAAGPTRVATVVRLVAAAEAAPGGEAGGEWTVREAGGEAGGEWTVREVVAHLAAVEAVVWQARLDQLADLSAAEPEWAWVEPGPLDTPETATLERALALFAARRSATLARVAGLDEAGWARAGMHAVYGRLDVAALLGIVVDHDDDHLAGLEARLAG